jgi:hypothetical protein
MTIEGQYPTYYVQLDDYDIKWNGTPLGENHPSTHNRLKMDFSKASPIPPEEEIPTRIARTLGLDLEYVKVNMDPTIFTWQKLRNLIDSNVNVYKEISSIEVHNYSEGAIKNVDIDYTDDGKLIITQK